MDHSAVLLTCIKVPHGFKTFVLSDFEWPLKTGFNVLWIILQYVLPALRYHMALRPLFRLFLSGHLRQVSMYCGAFCSTFDLH